MRINILKYEGYLTEEDRKKPFEHVAQHIFFKTNLDLTQDIEMTLLGNSNKISLENYTNDVMSFISYWTYFVKPGLNGFIGGNHKFKLNFEII